MNPLCEVKVVELARVLAGPWAGQLLADLGANVIKVERPGVGDETRTWGPPFVSTSDDVNLGAAYFHAANRGKRSVTADLDSAEGCDLVRRLAQQADVLIENFKSGGLARYGLDFATIHALNPRLVYCSITGFGQTGPYAQRAGYDFIIQGMSGLMDITGMADGEPVKVGVAYADVFTGVYAVVAILAALRSRDASGRGAHIDMSLLDVQVGVLANQALNYFVSGQSPQRLGNLHPNLAPYEVFPSADGNLIIAVGNDGQFGRLCRLLGDATLASSTEFATNEARVRNRSNLAARIAQWTKRGRRDELLQQLESAGIPAGAINTIAEAFDDPQVRHRHMRIDMEHPAAKGNSVPGVRAPIIFNGDACVAQRRSPALGEHTAEVLAGLFGDKAQQA